ncbi:MAG: 4Fe-4S binding protein [bacterium]|jgi:heterodisulfide reductase subunit A
MNDTPNNKNGKEEKLVTFRIDGKEVTAPERSFLLKAARANGIDIPTLCYYEHIEPYSVCRMCVVQVTRNGRQRIVTACNFPVQEGIVVETRNEKIIQHRKLLIEMMLARHSEVEVIKKLAKEYGVTKTRFKLQPSEECILCGLCVRVCNDLVQAHALCFAQRGPERYVTTPYDDYADNCIACGACVHVCPTNHMKLEQTDGIEILYPEVTLGPNNPIHIDFMQAVPASPWIDTASCIHFQTDGCGVCSEVCPTDCIHYDMQDTIEEVEVGNIVVASGFKGFDPKQMYQFGYGKLPQVMTSLEFERVSNAGGSTGGRILTPDGRNPESVAILHCIGSRDKHYNEYCSRICCMQSLKFAHLIREKTGAEVYQCYIDMRCFGKGYEEFYNRLLHEDVHFIRGKAVEVTDYSPDGLPPGKVMVRVEDTLLGIVRKIPVDIVILSIGLEPAVGVDVLKQTLRISRSPDGFYLERHPKLAPVSTATDGIYIAGCAQGPKDIPDTVAQANAAAAAVLQVISQGQVTLEPTTAEVMEELCTGCQTCLSVCPYDAIRRDEQKEKAVINDALCKGCGTCVAACPSGAIKQWGFDREQIMAEIDAVLAEVAV